MKLVTVAIVTSIAVLTTEVNAEELVITRVELGTSAAEASSPGIIGVTIRLFDSQNRPIRAERLPNDWRVIVARDRAPVSVALYPNSRERSLEGDFSLRIPGIYRLRGRVQDSEGRVIAESEIVSVTAVASLDFGVIRSGQTVCRQLPGGGRGVIGEVVPGHGELPRGLTLWGGCLIADDSVSEGDGTFRAAVIVVEGAGLGRLLERRYYNIRYEIQPRLVTPMRLLFGLGGIGLFGLLAALTFAIRRGSKGFITGTVSSPSESLSGERVRPSTYAVLHSVGRVNLRRALMRRRSVR